VFVPRPRLLGLDDAALPAIADAVGQAASEEGLQVLTDTDVRELLAQNAKLQALGGDADELSLASLGRAVGAPHLLALTVSRTPETTRVFAKLVEASAGAVLSRREVSAGDHGGDLLAAIKAATRLALAPVFRNLKGTVTLKSSEDDANVLVDGDQLGVTPLSPFPLTGGYHELTVSKESFLRWQQGVRVNGGDTFLFDVKLRPSPEFLRSYNASARRQRAVAWTGTGLFVPLLAGAVVSGLMVSRYNDQQDKDRAAAAALGDGATPQQIDDANQAITRDHNSAVQYQNLQYTLGACAVTSALVAGYFWIFGPSPSRFAQWDENAPAPAP
jgi:hypothetical protein